MGFLLARSGVRVTVLETHADFLRDFRGDTIHPSTFEVMRQVGLLDEVLAVTDFRASTLSLNFEGHSLRGPDFSHLDVTCPFIGFAPQWDLLNLVAEEAKRLPTFRLRMSTRATGVVREGGRVVGVRCEARGGSEEVIACDLAVAADGRGSTLRESAQNEVIEEGVPIDALWFRLDRPAGDDGHTLAWLRNGHMLVTIPRRTHYQIAMVVRKGAFPEIQSRGLPAFRETVSTVCPPLADVAGSLFGWEDVKLLTVQINRLARWHEPGLLFIGDAAHAMSPMGGVGINLAVQDAVAAANALWQPLRNGSVTEEDLRRVQVRREPPTVRTQSLQRKAHETLFGRSRGADQAYDISLGSKIAVRVLSPLLRRRLGHIIGMGFQPESVESPARVEN